jgi:hypothetical protein
MLFTPKPYTWQKLFYMIKELFDGQSGNLAMISIYWWLWWPKCLISQIFYNEYLKTHKTIHTLWPIFFTIEQTGKRPDATVAKERKKALRISWQVHRQSDPSPTALCWVVVKGNDSVSPSWLGSMRSNNSRLSVSAPSLKEILKLKLEMPWVLTEQSMWQLSGH